MRCLVLRDRPTAEVGINLDLMWREGMQIV